MSATLAGAAKYRRWARENGVIDSDRCEKREWAQSTMGALRAEARGALLTDEGWTEFVRSSVMYPHYSWRNCALVALQAPGAPMLATFMRWKHLGCPVREGCEAAVRIVSPPQPGIGFGTIKLHTLEQLIDVPEELGADALEIVSSADEALGALLEQFPRPAGDDEINELGAAVRAATIGDN